MSIKENESGEALLREKLLPKIRQIVADEKFKLDAFYLCGVASGLPNEGLQKACETYLTMIEDGQANPEIIADLIRELEQAVTTKPKVTVVGDLVNNRADIQEVFAYKELLWKV